MSITLLCLAWLASPQEPRAPQIADPTPADPSYYPALSSRGETSAVAFVDGTAYDQVLLSLSDGRGLSWTPPQRVDAGPAGTVRRTQDGSVQVFDDRIYVAWEDTRLGGLEVYFNSSADRGSSWAGEMLIPKGVAPPGTGGIIDWKMTATPDPAGGLDRVYFLFSAYPAGSLTTSLFLTASNDGGATFPLTVHVPAGYGAGACDVDAIDLETRGDKVMVLWTDDRAGANDVWYQRSLDGGATWLPADRQLNGTGPGFANGAVSLSAAGPNVLAAWTDERVAAPNDELRVAQSTNSGLAWTPDAMVGGYLPGIHDVTWIDTLMNESLWHVAWTDDRMGLDFAFAAATSTAGGAWIETPLSGGEAGQIHLNGHGDTISASWLAPAAGTSIQAAVARDGDMAWEAEFTVVGAPAGDFLQYPVVNYNDLYGNYHHAWVHHTSALSLNTVEIGGFRPQTVYPMGVFSAGNPIYFHVEHFPAAWDGLPFAVLVSGGLGSYPLPYGDGRETGLVSDVYLNYVLGNLPSFTGTLDATGAGDTPVMSWPPSVPAGTTLNLVAVAFDTAGGVTLGSVTDIASFVTL